ncbi:hypothetical protein Tco_0440161 [Tanacetum coccineum]
MPTSLKHMGGYTYKQLKGKSFDEIQKLFDKEMKRVNTFVAMGSEVQDSKEKKVEGSEQTAKCSKKKMLGRKRARKEQQQESSKKQRMEEDKESYKVDEVSEDDEGEFMKHLVIKKDEDIAIDVIPLAIKLPVIIDYKLLKEGVHFVRFDNLHIFMLVEKRYPLTPITITNMLNKKLQTDHQNEMCYQLLNAYSKAAKSAAVKGLQLFEDFLLSEDKRLIKEDKDCLVKQEYCEDNYRDI